MEDSLLSHIANNFISQYENVANSSISYLLNNYDAPKAALGRLLQVEEVPKNYITEKFTPTHGRPDICGIDDDGNIALIIEGKFWAGLTENQPGNYLRELPEGGKLLFLAPSQRIDALTVEFETRLNGVDNRIVIISWMDFIKAVEGQNSRKYDNALASDLLQLSALCKKMENEGMPPLSRSDLDPMIGRVTFQLADLIDDCNTRIRSWSQSNFQGMKSVGSKYGYGFYFRAFGFGCWLGLSTQDWFIKKSQTPIWLYIQTEAFKHDEQIYFALNNYNSSSAYSEKTLAKFAIVLKPGMDREQVVTSIVSQVYEVLSALAVDENL